jgi:hypothetical protein
MPPRPPGPGRPRRERRERERAQRKIVRLTERLAAGVPGGSPENPIDLPPASVVEGTARGTPCPQCGGELEIANDRATSTPRGVVRELRLICRHCHAPRTLWFRIAIAGGN